MDVIQRVVIAFDRLTASNLEAQCADICAAVVEHVTAVMAGQLDEAVDLFREAQPWVGEAHIEGFRVHVDRGAQTAAAQG